MMADCTITVIGNLTREPELRYTAGSKAVASLGVAVSRRYQVNNEWKEETSFFNVTAWGSLGENVAASLSKGSRVVITGRLDQRQYEKDGEKKYAYEIVADDIGVSLRWARATIEKVARENNAGATNNAPSHDPIYSTPEEPF